MATTNFFTEAKHVRSLTGALECSANQHYSNSDLKKVVKEKEQGTEKDLTVKRAKASRENSTLHKEAMVGKIIVMLMVERSHR